MSFLLGKAQNKNSVDIKDALGNTSATIDCGYPLNNGCFTITGTYPKINANNVYTVSSETYAPFLPLTKGTALNANLDDLYVKKIDIPFNFCFFGNLYNQLVIGSNGVITFNVSQLGNICFPTIVAANPNSLLPVNSIFGVLEDLVFSTAGDSEIYYYEDGVAPNRKMVITFYKGIISGCTDTSTSQIVLSEGTNEIDVFVDSKPLPCAVSKFKESLIGIQNSDGSVGYSPPGRNTGIWSASQEAWKFSPSGATVNPILTWTNSANQVMGSGASASVCPTKNDVYTLTAVYPVCGNYTVKGQFNVDFSADYPITTDYTKVFCSSGTAENINLDDYKANLTSQDPTLFKFSYYTSLGDAQNGTNASPTNVVVSGNTTYYVRVENKADSSCYKVVTLNFQFTASSNSISNSVTICDVNSDGVEADFLLSKLDRQLIPSGFSGTVTYFKNLSDAENNINAITNLDINTLTKFWIRLNNGECSAMFGPISVTFTLAPKINSPVNFAYTICDNENNGVEKFDLINNIGPLISRDNTLKFSFYYTYNEAYSGNTPGLMEIREGNYVLYVRVEDAGGCFSIAEANLSIVFTKVVAKDLPVYICFNGTDDVAVDLTKYETSMLVSPLTGVTIEYYNDYGNAVIQNAPLSSSTQTITDDGNFVTKIFYVRFTDAKGCFVVNKLSVNLVHPVPAISSFTFCDKLNDNVETVDLSPVAVQIVGNQSTATASFYESYSEAEAGTNSFLYYSLRDPDKNNLGTVTIYVKIVRFGCSEIYPIKLDLTSTPVVQVVSKVYDNVCDNNGDGIEIYDLTQNESSIYTDALPVIFTYYQNYDDTTGAYSNLIINPTQYPVNGVADVYAVVQFKDSGCVSVSKIHIKMNFLPAIKLHNAVLRKCDFQFNANELFTLSDAIPQMFYQSENLPDLSDCAVTYYKTQADANAGVSPINVAFIAMVSNETVWARFESNVTHCYSVASINLLTYLPPKAIDYTITGICDNNFDGIYDVNLMNYTGYMVNVFDPLNNFSFYLTQSDAINGLNPIPNPSNFSMNPFPSQIWVKIENIPGCSDVTSVKFTFGTKAVLLDPGPFELNFCDHGNDGSENIDLTQLESKIYSSGATFEYYLGFEDLNNGNKINNPSSYFYVAGTSPSKIFVKVNVSGFCPVFAEINLTSNKVPIFTLPDYYICPYNGDALDIAPDFSNLDIVHYQWIGPDGNTIATDQPSISNINEIGVYTLIVTSSKGCTYSVAFNVFPYDVPVITQVTTEDNKTYSVFVTANANKKVLYSVDTINWQESNVFRNLTKGIYNFYVKYKDEDCLGLAKEGFIFGVPNVITPNGDGVNDTWYVDDLHFFGGKPTNLEIYNRYGNKIFSQESATKLVWKGVDDTNSKVPTGTYWYVLKFPDGRLVNGWLLLRNRD